MTTQPQPDLRTALVLGGGGITGIAWMLGILKGLRDAGVDLTDADIVVGTSAGSVVGAQVTSGLDLDALYAGQLEPPDHEIGAAFGLRELVSLVGPALLPGSPRARRRRVGSLALRAHPGSGHDRVEVIKSRIQVGDWPDRDLRVTAVEAETGRFAVWTRELGVDLVEAVASSCAVPGVWPPVAIKDHRYIDGGVRTPANADLAHDADAVVVLAPIPRGLSKAGSVESQMRRLPARSTSVVPDKESLRAFGRNVLDPAKRAGAARAGLRQSADLVERVRVVWG
ncbi:patatin-like phospholipase family protein [Nocardioides marmoribigeumensis]|uniref:NTE family protein n=1 Tax=Nocardioides marmoribigeumensis TaxID=433649 RepID=A0ABU2BSA6_9ACTN|nr:patatin-like phospholipase family protein [Nocardioides marmoribigeumensis]MDR7361532.1 NTE family protein [Nocardioides marmoribigeumensis]